MKNLKYYQFAIIIALLVTATSCTVTRGGYYDEDPYESGSRYYGSTPYYGSGGSNYIILERDPFTGQYYEAAPRGTYYPNRSSVYRNYNNYPTYDRRYNSTYNDRRTNNSNRDNSSYRNNNNYTEQRQQQEQQRQENVEKMRSSKESILGKKKD